MGIKANGQQRNHSTNTNFLLHQLEITGFVAQHDSPENEVDENNNNSLHQAAIAADLDKFGMRLGGNPNLLNAKNRDGNTPFHLLMEHYTKSDFSLYLQIQEIIEKNPQAAKETNNDAKTPLDMAANPSLFITKLCLGVKPPAPRYTKVYIEQLNQGISEPGSLPPNSSSPDSLSPSPRFGMG